MITDRPTDRSADIVTYRVASHTTKKSFSIFYPQILLCKLEEIFHEVNPPPTPLLSHSDGTGRRNVGGGGGGGGASGVGFSSANYANSPFSSSPSSSTSSFSSTSSSSVYSLKNVHVSDALELALNILETVSEMTDDTDSVVDRLFFFSADNNRNLKRMLKIVVGTSWTAWKDGGRRGEGGERRGGGGGRGSVGGEDEDDDEEEEEDQETRELREEVTISAASLLYRLCEMVKYTSAEEDGIDLRKLLGILAEDSRTPQFYDALLRQTFKGIMTTTTMTTTTMTMTSLHDAMPSPTTTTTTAAAMSATEAITFFHRFSLVNFTLLHNRFLAKFIGENFLKEFRYYVDLKKIRALIPERFPIQAPAVALVQRVTDLVFHETL